jgi:hypothetical protein
MDDITIVIPKDKGDRKELLISKLNNLGYRTYDDISDYHKYDGLHINPSSKYYFFFCYPSSSYKVVENVLLELLTLVDLGMDIPTAHAQLIEVKK